MLSWSLKNLFRKVTHQQFLDYTSTFKQAAEQAFRAECGAKIRVLDQPEVYTSFVDDIIQANLNEINKAHTILETENPEEITPAIWKNAGFVGFTINPLDKDKAPSYAFASAEFKGDRPRQATFYIQGSENDDVYRKLRDDMLAAHNGVFLGGGFDGNGRRSGDMPASLGRGLPKRLITGLGR